MWRVPLFDADFGERERRAVADVLESGWLTSGPKGAELERRFAELCGTRDAVAVSSGTAALQLSLMACDLEPGDEVICPSLTFVATASAVLHAGATPVFADISSLDDPCISPEAIEARVTPRTRAIIVVHYAGYPCDMARIGEVARRRGLALIEDAAHAPGAAVGSRTCGSFGSTGCFSFYGNKNMTTGEGGMITTDDEELAVRLRRLRSHGLTTDATARHEGRVLGYDVHEIGHNFRMDELRAALGLVQLDGLEDRNQRREALGYAYRTRLDGVSGIHVPFRRPRGTPSHHVQPIVLPEGVDPILLREALCDYGVQTSHHYPPIHRLTWYRRLGYGPGSLPVTEEFASREVTLPLFPRLTQESLDYVCDRVLDALETTSETTPCVSSV